MLKAFCCNRFQFYIKNPIKKDVWSIFQYCLYWKFTNRRQKREIINKIPNQEDLLEMNVLKDASSWSNSKAPADKGAISLQIFLMLLAIPLWSNGSHVLMANPEMLADPSRNSPLCLSKFKTSKSQQKLLLSTVLLLAPNRNHWKLLSSKTGSFWPRKAMGAQLSAWTVGGNGKERNTQSRVYSAKIDAMEE